MNNRIVIADEEGAQEAREVIRPADMLSDVEADARRPYQLTLQRCIACQMPPLESTATRVAPVTVETKTTQETTRHG